jgi:DNA-binding NarL/FixJ family response regulator
LANQGKTRVLIVDGLRAVREGLAALLTSEGDFEVVGEADTEADALERAVTLHPDLVLLDLELPTMDGEAALRRLREAGVTAVVVALGLSGDTARQQRLINGCCRGYIQKGIRPQDVLRTVRAALGQASA